MNKKQFKNYLHNHFSSLFIMGFGTFMLLFLVIGSIKILIDETFKPFNPAMLTFLISVLWGLEFFRFFGEMAKEKKKEEDKKMGLMVKT
jgi:CHASE2 domain-containing sensor protein